MNFAFFSYFFKYIFKSRTRQRLLSLAIFGLLISSFSLVVLQGIMGGLQKGVIERSKEVHSYGSLRFKSDMTTKAKLETLDFLEKKEIPFVAEYELELLIKNENRIEPAVVHGLHPKSTIPSFLEDKNIEDLTIGVSLSRKLNTYFGDSLKLISPAHIDYLFMEIPRQVSAEFSDILVTGDDIVDTGHAWTSIRKLQSLARENIINKVSFYSDKSFSAAYEILSKNRNYTFYSWEQQNKSLAWALKLETTVMIILFIAMSLLVAICITSGFMIFFDKAKTDLISFWILGQSKKEIFKLLLIFTQFMNVTFTFIGVLLGYCILRLLESKAFSFIPEFFIEQSLPVNIELSQLIFAFLIPYLIASVFSIFSFKVFKNENSSFLNNIRSVS